jgi:hypothetical protein
MVSTIENPQGDQAPDTPAIRAQAANAASGLSATVST